MRERPTMGNVLCEVTVDRISAICSTAILVKKIPLSFAHGTLLDS